MNDAKKNHIYGNESLRVIISSDDGRILSLAYKSEELLVESLAAFELRLLEIATGEYRLLSSRDFAHFTLTNTIGTWTACSGYNDLTVCCTIRFEGRFLHFRPSVRNVPAEYWIDLIEIPQVVVSRNNDIFWSHNGGCIVHDRWLANTNISRIGFPSGACNVYPGTCQMQFYAAYRNGRGLYFAADDYSHSTKSLELNVVENGGVNLRIGCTWGEEGLKRDAELPFDLLLGGYDGDWQDACEMYRQWVKQDPKMNFTPLWPEWFEKSPVVIAYPVCGAKEISPEHNRFQPYDRAFPRVEELSAQLDSAIMVHLMRWDHNGPWLPPYHWPPTGDIDAFFRFRDLLHQSGHYLGLYGSGTSYTRQSKINGYSDEVNFVAHKLERHMARGPKNELDSGICPHLRKGCEMCITEQWCRDTLREQVVLAAKNGVDFFQLLDQNQGAESFTCYSREHHHPPLPGVWQTEAMVSLIAELNQAVRDVGSTMILGAENAAPGPYLAGLPFNDVRSPNAFGREVPAAAYVFHQYSPNFMGNQVEAWREIDCLASPENLQYRLANGFVRGELLTLVLRDSGEIDWGHTADWSKPAPKQEPVIKLVKHLNQLRRRYPAYLLHGEMQKPFAHIDCREYVITYFYGEVRHAALLQSSWLAQDSTKAQFVVNFREQPETAMITTPQQCTIVCDGKHYTVDKGQHRLGIPPLTAAILLFSKAV